MIEVFLWGLRGAASLVLGALVVPVRSPRERGFGRAVAFAVHWAET